MSRGRSSREAAPFQSDERRELLYSLLGTFRLARGRSRPSGPASKNGKAISWKSCC